MTRIGVVSDTHIQAPRTVMPPSIIAALQGVDLILHAGDSCNAMALEALERVAPVIAVHGNVDPPDLFARLPSSRIVDVADIRIGLTHGHLGAAGTTPERALEQFHNTPNLQVIVFGHSHIPLIERHGSILLFNPGSATQPRSQPRASLGILEIVDGKVHASHVYLR